MRRTRDWSDARVAKSNSAREGRIYVLGVTCCLLGSDVPRDLPAPTRCTAVTTAGWPRNTTICGAGGEILAGPLEAAEGVVYAEIEPSIACDRAGAPSRAW